MVSRHGSQLWLKKRATFPASAQLSQPWYTTTMLEGSIRHALAPALRILLTLPQTMPQVQ